MLEQLIVRQRLTEGCTLVDATRGNSSIALAVLGKAIGCKVHIVMPDWLSKHNATHLRALGALVTLVWPCETDMLSCMQLAGELAMQREDALLLSPFTNRENTAAHARSTGPEIVRQLKSIGKQADAFVSCVDSGGTITGVAACLQTYCPKTLIQPVEAAEAPYLTEGYNSDKYAERSYDLKESFLPPVVKLNSMETVMQVHDNDALMMAKKITAELGLAAGYSAGINVVAAIRMQQQLGAKTTVVTILPDSQRCMPDADLFAFPVCSDSVGANVHFKGYIPIPAGPGL